MKDKVKETMDFLGMLGFSPSKEGKKTAEKWLKNQFVQVKNEGKLEGMDKAKKIIWEK